MVTVAVMHLTCCLPRSLPSRHKQTMAPVSTRNPASQILHALLDAQDKFESVGPGLAALCCNWVPRHPEIHVSIGHMGPRSKWHQRPTSWMCGCRGGDAGENATDLRSRARSGSLIMDGAVTGDTETVLFSSCEPDKPTHSLVQMGVFNVSR